MRLVDIDALDAAMYHKSFEVDDGRQVWNSGLWIRYKIYEEASLEAPTVDAVPSQLTKEDIKTIRIHMNALKEKLCMKHRYKEADEYQQIVDKLDAMM